MMNQTTRLKAWQPRAQAIALTLVGSLVILFSATNSAVAASAPTAHGSITVSPAIVNLSLPSGEQQATTTITIANTYSNTIRLAAEWQAIDEATGRLIPSGPLNPTLAQALRISETDIAIPAQSSKQLKVTVQNSPALAPGGHYAILVFTVMARSTEKLGLQSALSVTVFVVKRDGAKTAISLESIMAQHSLFSLPNRASLTIVNTGNVHVVPRAAITIERHGEVIAKGVANQASSPLLPGKKSTYQVSFTNYKRVLLPSRLQLRTVYRVDQSGGVEERVSSFLYVPIVWPFTIIALGLGWYFLLRKKRRADHIASIPPATHAVPKPSKIPVASVEISPSHAVPVERKAKAKKPK